MMRTFIICVIFFIAFIAWYGIGLKLAWEDAYEYGWDYVERPENQWHYLLLHKPPRPETQTLE